MTTLEDDEQRMLQEARRACSPTPADAERVLAATLTTLSTTPLVTTTSTVGARRWFGHASTLLATVAIGALCGTGGYYAGYANGLQDSDTRQETQRPAVQIAAPAQPLPPLLARRGTSEPSQATSPSVSSALQPEAKRPTVSRTALVSPSRNAITSDPGAQLDELLPNETLPSLEEEVRQMRRVERALRERMPTLAIRVLGELDRDVPNGKLGQERAAASAIAHCALGDDSASTRVDNFIRAYPDSAYRARVDNSCNGAR